jgi:hypothetical protein
MKYLHRARRLTAAAVLTLTLTACVAPSGGTSSGGHSGTSAGSIGGADAPSSGPSGQAGLRDYTCELKFQPPPSGIGTGASIKGTVFVKCPDHKPVDHHVTLILERDLNGNWIPKQERTWDGVPQDPMSIHLLTTSCVPGSWRVHVEVWGIAANGKSFASSTSPLEFVSTPKEVHPSDCG